MFNIEKFLNKFTKEIKSTESNKNIILDVIKKHTQIELQLNDVEIKDYQVVLKASPAVLNKIFIYKQKILDELGTSLPIKIVDIK